MNKLAVFLFVMALPLGVWAQQLKERKWEIGAQVTSIRLSRLEETATGAGGRVAYNLNDFITLEGAADYFPARQRALLGVGVRGGIRNRRYGLYGKWRPGVAYLEGRYFFALDAGGALEIYPNSHTMFRLDVGDTRIFIRQAKFPNAFVRDSYSHNLQITAGVGFRF